MKILVAGDFCPQYRVAELFERKDFASVLKEVKGVIEQYDYPIVNFECPVRLGGEKPNLDRLSLFCSENGMEAAAYAGFKCLTLANNHFRDWGGGGVVSTLSTCEKLKLDHVGGGADLKKASETLYKEIGGKVLAIINCCEHEFSLATTSRGGSNPLDLVAQFNAIQEAKSQADFTIVIVHGGHEHYQLPSPRMVESYRFFVDAGADAVVNHHQHCVSGYEIYKDRPIFYGIGNFCFDMKTPPTKMWHTGYMVGLEFLGGKVNFEIHPYTQCEEKATISLINKNVLRAELDSLNAVIGNAARLREEADKYYEQSMNDVRKVINPLLNVRYISRLYRKGLIPDIITKRWLMYLCNYTMCESHRDKMDYFFEHNMY